MSGVGEASRPPRQKIFTKITTRLNLYEITAQLNLHENYYTIESSQKLLHDWSIFVVTRSSKERYVFPDSRTLDEAFEREVGLEGGESPASGERPVSWPSDWLGGCARLFGTDLGSFSRES